MKKKLLTGIVWGLNALFVCAFGQTAEVTLDKVSTEPFSYSVAVPDGNYRVTVTVGNKKRAGKLRVKLKPRELNYKNWDDSLTLSFCGPAPAVKSIKVEPVSDVTTVFLCGNSTVVDQEDEPWASWGQVITRWFDDKVVVANFAESGLSCTSFLAQLRLDKILSMMKKVDYVMVEFGHNDEKEKKAGDGAWYSYSRNLKIFVDRVREKGGNIIFVTPTARRLFTKDHQLGYTHGDYPEAMRTVAKREDVPYIELNGMTRQFYEALGEEGSKQALVHYPANTFANQPKPLAHGAEADELTPDSPSAQ